jgi:hypothetical protein
MSSWKLAFQSSKWFIILSFMWVKRPYHFHLWITWFALWNEWLMNASFPIPCVWSGIGLFSNTESLYIMMSGLTIRVLTLNSRQEISGQGYLTTPTEYHILSKTLLPSARMTSPSELNFYLHPHKPLPARLVMKNIPTSGISLTPPTVETYPKTRFSVSLSHPLIYWFPWMEKYLWLANKCKDSKYRVAILLTHTAMWRIVGEE